MRELYSERNADNDKFIEKSRLAFNDLFQCAKQQNELHYALALSPEYRPGHHNTAQEADLAFEQYVNFLEGKDYPDLRSRIALAFYCHLSEASGYWEIVKNMLCIANGERYNVWPFKEFVKKHKISGKLIAPNSNKVLLRPLFPRWPTTQHHRQGWKNAME